LTGLGQNPAVVTLPGDVTTAGWTKNVLP